MKRLRVAYVTMQPVVVWDDGDEITPGPTLAVQQLTLRQVAEMAEKLPAEMAALEASLLAEETDKAEPPAA